MPVQIGWLEMGWQLRPNEVEESGRHHCGDWMEEERERERERQTQRKEKRVRWMTKRNEGGREGGREVVYSVQAPSQRLDIKR